MSLFERYPTLWVALCIGAGIVLGKLMPGAFHAIASAEVAQVNLPVAAIIWLMIFTFAPIVGLLLGLASITVPWQTLLLSVFGPTQHRKHADICHGG